MKRFAVIGHPIGHSLSPLMHTTAFQALGLEHTYEALDIDPAALIETVTGLRDPNWGGFNVTTPHKETIIPLLDEIAAEANAIGAVNTVVNHGGRLVGFNTDVAGIERSLERFRTEIQRMRCLILGAGGAARSAAYVLSERLHARSITIAARSADRARLIAKDLQTDQARIGIIGFSGNEFESAVRSHELIINATTVGMFPRVHESPLATFVHLTDRHIVFDLIYRPLATRLLQKSKAAGARTIGGLEMFVHQGAEAFKLWIGMKMPIERIRAALESKLASDTD